MRGATFVQVGLSPAYWLTLILVGNDDRRRREIEVRDCVMRLREGCEDVVADAQVQRQCRRGMPVILQVCAGLPRTIVGRHQAVGALHAEVVSLQESGKPCRICAGCRQSRKRVEGPLAHSRNLFWSVQRLAANKGGADFDVMGSPG